MKARVTENRLFRFWDRWLTDDEYPHLFVVDLETRKVTDLLPGSQRHFDLQEGTGDFDVSPDGATLAFSANTAEPPYRTLNRDVFAVPDRRRRGAEPDSRTTSPTTRIPSSARTAGRLAFGCGAQGRRLARPHAPGGAGRRHGPHDASSPKAGRTPPASGPGRPDGRDIVFHAEARARMNLYADPAAGGAPREVHRGGDHGDVAALRRRVGRLQPALPDPPPESGPCGPGGDGLGR